MPRIPLILTMKSEYHEDERPSREDLQYWMARGLEGIITDYVLSKVKEAPYNRHGYVADLMEIEMFLVSRPGCLAGVHALRGLRQRYPEEYRSIESEIDMRLSRKGVIRNPAFDEQTWLGLGGKHYESFAARLLEFWDEWQANPRRTDRGKTEPEVER